MSKPTFQAFIDGNGTVVSPSSKEDADKLASAGFTPASAEQVHAHELEKEYGTWGDKAQTFVQNLIPGVQAAAAYGVSKLYSPEVSQAFAAELANSNQVNSGAALAGKVIGGVGIAATTGFGAAGLVAGEGAGALATSAAATFAQNGVMSAAMGLDENAVHYIQTGEGSEKLASQLGWDFLLGGALGVGISAGGQALGSALKGAAGKAAAKGAQLSEAADQSAVKAVMTEKAVEKMSQTPTGEGVLEFMKTNNLFSKSIPDIRDAAKASYKEADGLFKEARFGQNIKMELADQVNLRKELLTTAKGMDESVRATIKKGLAKPEFAPNDLTQTVETLLKEPATPRTLHNLRQNLDKFANWNDISAPTTKAVDKMRELVTQNIDTMLQKAPDKELAAKFMVANKQAHVASTIMNGLKRPPPGSSFNREDALIGGGIAYLLHATGLSVPAGVLLAGKVAAKYAPAVGRSAQRGLASVLQAADSKFANAVAGALGSKPAALGSKSGSVALLTTRDYPAVSQMVRQIAQRPEDGIREMHDRLAEAGHSPQEIDSAIPVQMRAASYLASVAPAGPQELTVAPQKHQPDRQEQVKFMNRVNAIRDPAEALRNPTPEKLEALRAVYPETMVKTVNIVSQQAATRPQLSRGARIWAQAVTGVPGSRLELQPARAVLRGMDAASAEQRQMAQQQQGGGGKPMKPGVQSQQTRLERMSGE